VTQRFTRDEAARMLGITRRQMDYWASLKLVSPEKRWSERFYSFSDLVALETVKQLTRRGIAARRLRRALEALRGQLGDATTTLSRLRITSNGREVVVSPPSDGGAPIEPLTKQFVLDFETASIARKIRALPSRTAEEWFEIGLEHDTRSATMHRAAEAYRHAVALAPDWVEAHLNLGTALFHLDESTEAKKCFEKAVALDPQNALAHFNLGCVLNRQAKRREAVAHLERAVFLKPSLADAHLNLAMLYDGLGYPARMKRHLLLYLKYDPQGAWAAYAQSRLPARRPPADGERGKVTPFRKGH
jgi:tetratricopeptide (TPR) repeat protein